MSKRQFPLSSFPASPSHTRRRFLGQAAAGALLPLMGWHSAMAQTNNASDPGAFDPLVLHGGPATPSLVLVRLAEAGLLAPQVKKTGFSMFRGQDEVRAGIAGNGWPISMVPSNLAAMLYNKGMPVRYMNVLTWGPMYLVSTRADISSLKDLRDLRSSKVMLGIRGDALDALFRDLLKHAGIDPEQQITLVYSGSPVEAAQLLVAGRVDHAVLAEPHCSAVLAQTEMQAKTADKNAGDANRRQLHRGPSLRELRRAAHGDDRIPLAGLMVHQRLADARPNLVAALKQALPQALAWTLANPAAAAQAAAPHFGLPAPVIERAIPYSALTVDEAKSHRDALDGYFKMLHAQVPALVGGRLPDDGFYL